MFEDGSITNTAQYEEAIITIKKTVQYIMYR